MKIRITGGGIYGTRGEIPVGTELEVSDLPAGWKGRAVVVGEDPGDDATVIANDEDERIDAARREVAEAAQKHIDGLNAEHATALQAATERADAAEAQAADLQARVDELEQEAAKPEAIALTGKNKAELLEIAKAEGVEIEEGATNADIVSAIELAREEATKA